MLTKRSLDPKENYRAPYPVARSIRSVDRLISTQPTIATFVLHVRY